MKDFSKNPQSSESSRCYQFGSYRFDCTERVLRKDGHVIPLTPKALDTLAVLIKNHEKVVSKDELMQTIWPGTFVEEGVLAQNILTLRKTLQNPDWIETIPKRGYRFLAQVSETGDETEPARRSRLMWTIAAGVAILAASLVIMRWYWERTHSTPVAVRSLAVLPFQSISNEPSYLGLGLADVLINRLGALPQIVVRPTSAVRKFTQPTLDPLRAGRDLGVDAVLEGHIQRDGERVRVTVELRRVSDGASLWAGKFDKPFRDLFTLEDSIAHDVADGLILNLTDPERSRLTRRYTENAEAWDAYLRGRYAWSRRTPEGHQKAIEEFQQATRIDSRYALAYAGLADAYALLGSNPNRALPRAEAMEKAREAALKAIQLDSGLAEAHTSLAFILMHYDWRWSEAEKEFQRALALNPNYPTAHQWHAINFLITGHPDESIEELKKAQELDPTSLIVMADMAEMHGYLRRDREAEAEAHRVLDLDPTFVVARYWLARALVGEQRYQEAEAEAALPTFREDPYCIAALGYIYATADREADAHRVLTHLIRLVGEDYGLDSYLRDLKQE